jgi:hypothetical protein
MLLRKVKHAFTKILKALSAWCWEFGEAFRRPVRQSRELMLSLPSGCQKDARAS